MNFKKEIDALKEELVQTVVEALRIKSVEEPELPGMPFGKGNNDVLNYVLNKGENMGFKSKNLDGYAGHLDMGDGEEVIGILGHLDVVPEGDGWTYPPYGAEIHDEKIYARGAIDDKGPTIAALFAMKAVKDSGVSLNRKVRLILGLNEESGWKCMEHYFKNEAAPTMAFTPDANFPIIHGEKGIIGFTLNYKLESLGCDMLKLVSLKGGSALNMVADHAEALVEVLDRDGFIKRYSEIKADKKLPIEIEEQNEGIRICATGKSAHGSTPEKGENAITFLLDFLLEIVEGDCPLKKFLELYSERLAYQFNGEGIGAGLSDELSGKLNLNVGIIELVEDTIKVKINIRYPISSSSKEVYDGIRDNIEHSGFELEEGIKDSLPLYVPLDSELVQTLLRVYQEQTKDYDTKPIVIGGGTYARATKNAVAFGPVFPGQKEIAHQKDEHISIEDLLKLVNIYAHAIYELAK